MTRKNRHDKKKNFSSPSSMETFQILKNFSSKGFGESKLSKSSHLSYTLQVLVVWLEIELVLLSRQDILHPS